MITVVIITIAVAFLFDFLNGMNDAANSIATIVSTKVLSPFAAVLWAAFFNFVAVFILGTHVASTIGKGTINSEVTGMIFHSQEYYVLAALIGSVIWTYLCTHFGIPISVSHALVGGLIGPALFYCGPEALIASGIIKILLFIVLSPLIGMVLGYLIMVITYWLSRKKSPRKVDSLFRVLQLLSSAIFSLGHGSNDAQKTMGVIWFLLITTGYMGADDPVPIWLLFGAYGAIALGTISGGWKVIKTLGGRLTDLKPVQGFCAETAGAVTVLGSTFFGIPVSTTHTITGSIIGVGITRRVSAVRWGLASNIVVAWVLTIPATMLVSVGIYALFDLLNLV